MLSLSTLTVITLFVIVCVGVCRLPYSTVLLCVFFIFSYFFACVNHWVYLARTFCCAFVYSFFTFLYLSACAFCICVSTLSNSSFSVIHFLYASSRTASSQSLAIHFRRQGTKYTSGDVTYVLRVYLLMFCDVTYILRVYLLMFCDVTYILRVYLLMFCDVTYILCVYLLMFCDYTYFVTSPIHYLFFRVYLLMFCDVTHPFYPMFFPFYPMFFPFLP